MLLENYYAPSISKLCTKMWIFQWFLSNLVVTVECLSQTWNKLHIDLNCSSPGKLQIYQLPKGRDPYITDGQKTSNNYDSGGREFFQAIR